MIGILILLLSFAGVVFSVMRFFKCGREDVDSWKPVTLNALAGLIMVIVGMMLMFFGI